MGDYDVNPNDHNALYCKVLGLLIRCPKEAPSETCSLQKARELPARERIEWLGGLSDEELLDIALEHKKCFEDKNS
jgi:hypothetical protein